MKNLFAGFLTLWACLAAQADDIEIYQGAATGVTNNVMFLMDTSGSMADWVDLDIGPYDPNRTYPIAINGYDPETYYYSSALDGDASTEIEAELLHRRFLHKDALDCDIHKATIESEGFVENKDFKRWNPEKGDWKAPIADLSPEGSILDSLKEQFQWTGLDRPQGTLDPNYTWVCKNDQNNPKHPGHSADSSTTPPLSADSGGKYIDQSLNNDKYRNSLGPVTGPDHLIGWFFNVDHIYKGNYLNYQIFERGNDDHEAGEGDTDGIGDKDDHMSKMTIVRAAAKTAVTASQDLNLNLGLARFDAVAEGGFIDLQVAPIADNKDSFIEKLDAYLPIGQTPLSESYYEIALYYRGDTLKFGGDLLSAGESDEWDGYAYTPYSRVLKDDKYVIHRNTDGRFRSASRTAKSRYKRTPSIAESRVNNTGSIYQSPIINACQAKSVIVLFTDGSAQGDESANSAIQNMIKNHSSTRDIGDDFPDGLDPDGCSGEGGCADELAYYLANYDQNEDLDGDQLILTYVVGGFFSGSDSSAINYLKSIAHHGGGEYFSGDNEEEIAAALGEIFSSTADAPTTFVAPALAVSSYNSLAHKNELYYAMFKPNNSGNWKGNLKQYALNENGLVVDANSLPIVGTDGNFVENARSFWTPAATPDGPNVLLGGAAQHLTKELKIFTHLTTGGGTLATTITDTPQIRALMQIPESMSSTDFTKISNWANRIDSYDVTDTRREMEDPLHSQPVVINYSAAQSVVYMATNSGYLHAFEATKNESDFKEYFSYVPKELLPNIAAYANGTSLRKDELYGLDGHISYWFKDVNKNGLVDVSDGDRVILYIGMRRGGNHYYALDVTDPDTPKYLWQIDGGTGGTSGFERLGQTWSEMTLAKVNWDGALRVVLLFGGGYDENEDDATAASSSEQQGNALYMVDALDGPNNDGLLWSASKTSHDLNNSDMTASFMNNIRLVDFNGDRITDFFYASDVAGRIWRFDINKNNAGKSDFADGGIIFDANGDTSDNVYNRFYNSPSVSYFEDKAGDFLTLAIGTGFRASPLSTSSDDAFYVVKDYDVSHKPTSYTTLTPSDLAHYALANDALSNDDAAKQKNGWKFTLAGTSEKVLADALTTHGHIIFTTFAPNSVTNSTTGMCGFDLGQTKSYVIEFQGGIDGKPEVVPPVCPVEGCPEIPPFTPPSTMKIPTCEELGTCEEPDDDCEDDGSCPKPTSCEDGGTAVLIGTAKLDKNFSRCDILKKDYWLEK